MLKYALLGFLNYRPMTGYDLELWIKASTGHFWHAKLSQIYTTLKSMEAEALITSHVEAGTSRPDRRVYTITEAGKAELMAWLRAPLIEHEIKKDTLLLKMFFGLPAGKQALLTQLRLQLDLHRQQQRLYEEETPLEMLRFLEDQPEIADHALLWDLARRFGVMYEETYVRWIEESIRVLEQTLSDDSQK
ncbi:MAG: PadR family transcriptional regulator [Anaerolineae bacterium]|nr:PadR family transcriptional regulator [Anaerolineae bacterium]